MSLGEDIKKTLPAYLERYFKTVEEIEDTINESDADVILAPEIYSKELLTRSTIAKGIEYDLSIMLKVTVIKDGKRIKILKIGESKKDTLGFMAVSQALMTKAMKKHYEEFLSSLYSKLSISLKETLEDQSL